MEITEHLLLGITRAQLAICIKSLLKKLKASTSCIKKILRRKNETFYSMTN